MCFSGNCIILCFLCYYLKVFRVEPFFFGKNNYDQLVKIAKVLGTADLLAYLEKYDLTLDSNFDGLIGRYSFVLFLILIKDIRKSIGKNLLHQILNTCVLMRF